MAKIHYTVEDLMRDQGETLQLTSMSSPSVLKKAIKVPEVHRPGITLAGYTKYYVSGRFLIFGRLEVAYLQDLEPRVQYERLSTLITDKTPAVVVCGPIAVPEMLAKFCHEKKIPLLRSKKRGTSTLSHLSHALLEIFSSSVTQHGTLVEAYGMGVLIQGDSSVGKSEAALGLIERGHRLISDDVVKVRKVEGSYLEGTGPELTRHLMEIRGIGVINVAHLHGAVCVREKKRLDLSICLEAWSEHEFYDRMGLDEKYIDILGIKIPFYRLPVKPGRDVVLLIETIVLNHRLKQMGYHSAQEFDKKLLKAILEKSLKGDV